MGKSDFTLPQIITMNSDLFFAIDGIINEIIELISAEDLDLTEYSDTLVYRVIERVTVLSKEKIRIRFVGGFEITQPLH